MANLQVCTRQDRRDLVFSLCSWSGESADDNHRGKKGEPRGWLLLHAAMQIVQADDPDLIDIDRLSGSCKGEDR